MILPTSNPRLSLIPADTWLERVEVTEALAADRYSHERLKEILKPLKQFDTIIIDTPPSLCWLTESALIASAICACVQLPLSFTASKDFSAFLNLWNRFHNATPLKCSA